MASSLMDRSNKLRRSSFGFGFGFHSILISWISSSCTTTSLLFILTVFSLTTTQVSALPSSFNSSSVIPASTSTSNLIARPIALFRSQISHPQFPPRIQDPFDNFSNLEPQAQRNALRQLKQYSHQFFVLNLDNGFFIQMAIAACVLAVLVLIGASVILSRMWRKTFWVFKLTRRQEGLYLIPNALNVFLLFEGAFALLWISFVIYIWKLYDLEVDHLQSNIEGFDMYAWLPLWLGAFFAGWGSFYTAPGALDKGPFGEKVKEDLSEKKGSWRPKWFRFKYFSKPILINIFCIGSGFVIAAALIAPTILAQRSRNSAFSDYLDLAAQIDSQLASPSAQTISAIEIPSILRKASLVWDGADENQWYLNLGYILWTIFASAFLLFYVPSGGYLVWLVWTQVRAQKGVLDGIEKRAREAQGARVRPASGLSFRGSQPPGDSLLFQPLSFPSDEDQDNSVTVVPSGIAQPSSPGVSQSHTSPRTPATIVKELKGEVKEIFFPPLRADARKRVNRKPSSHSTPTARYRYIRRCFINLTILYVGITLGATVFLVIAARLAANLYQSVLDGPQSLTEIVYQSHIPTAWGAVVFGSATIGSIFVRHFDPASGNDSMKSPVQRSKRPGKSPFAFASKEKQFSPHDRSRTLPPVPESVTGTMGDQTMTDAIVLPTDEVDPRGGAPDSSSGDLGAQSFGSMRGKSFGEKRAMKFSLGRDSRKPGALILRVMDPASQTTSHASMGGIGADGYEAQQRTGASANDVERLESHAADIEAEQTSSRRSNRSRRFPFINRPKPTEEFPQDVTQFSDFDQVSSLRSVDGRRSSVGNGATTGEMVYYATPYGSIPAPAPREKPLPPARTPPRSPGAEVTLGNSGGSGSQSPSDSSRSRSGSGSGSGSASRSRSQSFEIRSSLSRQRQLLPLCAPHESESASASASAQTLESAGVDPHIVKAQVQALPDRSTIPPSPKAPRFQVKELDATTPPTSEADHGGGLGMTEAWSSPNQPSRSSTSLSRSASSPFHSSPHSSPHSPRRPGQTSPWIAREWEASLANEVSRRSTDSTRWGTPNSSVFPSRNYSLNLSRAPGSSGPSQSVLDLALRSPSTASIDQETTPMASPIRRVSVPTLPSSPDRAMGGHNLQARESRRAANQVSGSPSSPAQSPSRTKNQIAFPTATSFADGQVDAILPDSPRVRHRFSAISEGRGSDTISSPSSPPPSGPLPLPPTQQHQSRATNPLPYVSPVRRPVPLQDLEPPPRRRNRASASWGRNSSNLVDAEGEARGINDDRPRLSPGIFF